MEGFIHGLQIEANDLFCPPIQSREHITTTRQRWH